MEKYILNTGTYLLNFRKIWKHFGSLRKLKAFPTILSSLNWHSIVGYGLAVHVKRELCNFELSVYICGIFAISYIVTKKKIVLSRDTIIKCSIQTMELIYIHHLKDLGPFPKLFQSSCKFELLSRRFYYFGPYHALLIKNYKIYIYTVFTYYSPDWCHFIFLEFEHC